VPVLLERLKLEVPKRTEDPLDKAAAMKLEILKFKIFRDKAAFKQVLDANPPDVDFLVKVSDPEGRSIVEAQVQRLESEAAEEHKKNNPWRERSLTLAFARCEDAKHSRQHARQTVELLETTWRDSQYDVYRSIAEAFAPYEECAEAVIQCLKMMEKPKSTDYVDSMIKAHDQALDSLAETLIEAADNGPLAGGHQELHEFLKREYGSIQDPLIRASVNVALNVLKQHLDLQPS